MAIVALPTVEIDGKVYFIDKRLKELRNVNDPHDSRPLDEIPKEVLSWTNKSED